MRLLRLISFHQSGTPSLRAAVAAHAVARVGCSILITSAPKSPRIWQHSGPARIVETSRTRSPSSGAEGATASVSDSSFRLEERCTLSL